MRFLTWSAAVALAVATASAGSAAETVAQPDSGQPAPVPIVGLDALLRLPNSYEAEVDRRTGATAGEWRARFEQARADLDAARRRLEEIEQELQNVSHETSAYTVGALPGVADSQPTGLSLRLRQDVRVQRAEIDSVESRLRALDIEADLAAVPQAWRE